MCACNKNDSYVKDNFEKYNKDNDVKVNISDSSIFINSKSSDIKNLFKNGNGVIFIGDFKSNVSRSALNILLNAVDNTDITNVYFSEDLNIIKDYIDEDVSKPLIVFVVEGKADSYHVGTIDNKDVLSNDEEEELYNIYLDGIHKVLNDVCDERC